jgi:preprotein translocase subunit SecE
MEKPSSTRLPTIAPLQFFREIAIELKKVTWPTRAETIKLTAVVVAVSSLVALYVGGLDIIVLRITSALLGT